nr:MAG TPA: hypothetical protein [Caudoviricetes sp.]
MTEYISVQSSQDVIEHYGIKGMRWGIRSRHGSLRSDYREYSKLRKKSNKSLPSLLFKNSKGYNEAKYNYHLAKSEKAKYKKNMYDSLLSEKSNGKKIKSSLKSKLKNKINSNHDKQVTNTQKAIHYLEKHEKSFMDKEGRKQYDRITKKMNAVDLHDGNKWERLSEKRSDLVRKYKK